jgi:hypothetical protein
MNPQTGQLSGWKEIANHLGRSVRCVQRWGKDERLPVRRHGHRRGVSVYALREELDIWWREECPNKHSGELESLRGKQEQQTRRQPAPVAGRTLSMDTQAGHGSNQDHRPVEQLAREVAMLLLSLLETLAALQVSSAEASYVPALQPGSIATRQTLSAGD